MAIDRSKPDVAFNPAPPGYSLTSAPGSEPWVQPPKMTNVNQVVEFLFEKYDNPKKRESVADVVNAGTSCKEVVDFTALAMVMEGLCNPDVAELSKFAHLQIIVDAVAQENGDLPVLIFPDKTDKENAEDMQNFKRRLQTMERRNPELYGEIMSSVKRSEQRDVEQQEEERRQYLESATQSVKRSNPSGFISGNNNVEEEEAE